ncbi:hypothetical protein LOCC1_G002501 [Lachnellula occidentalis]|uniref:Uncharacterized protein n=1 Tax=Lachnellula occidentalis TaxID=215460 RepID=A0A8H8S589_9HELO|nr:hypothetical protein LOCC1_G002501 [Lachnellula occidentalis]
MARIKTRPVTAHDSPETLAAGPSVNANFSSNTPLESVYSSTALSICPHCRGIYTYSAKDFRHHVASCTANTDAGDEDDDEDDDDSSRSSSLTPPPDSPSVAVFNNNTITVDASRLLGGKHSSRITSIEVNGHSPANGILHKHNLDRAIRAYINPETEFAYYDKVDDRETSIATRRNSEEPEYSKSSADPVPEGPNEDKPDVRIRYPFPKFTPLDVFEVYLGGHEDLPYEDLYRRTSNVTGVLADYQKEWETIGKEIDEHEAYTKAQAKISADKTKAIEEEKTKAEDQKYLEIGQTFKTELRLSRSDWDRWLEERQALFPDQSDIHECLRNLRNPTFLQGVHKRQKVSKVDNIDLANRPILQERVTKEEIAGEKRKRYGKLLDQTTFDDMKHADAYGFNYSSQLHHVGNQPQPYLNHKAKARGPVFDEGRGGRSQRTAAKRSYDADKSVTPETDEEELPAKRARKARNLEATLDFQTRPRTSPQSRGGTPAVRVFPSGKRVGRPPTKSKLKEFQIPPQSTSPTLENGTAPRKLAPRQEEALHESVENLVNHVQPRRTRGKSTGFDDSSKSTSAASSRPSTSSSLEHRGRKLESNNTEPDTLVVEGPAPSVTPLPPPVATKSRKRKVKEEDIDESLLDAEQLEALRKKRIKSHKLSESLRKRWEKGEMATAMESRKATNAKKKAAKLEAKQVQVQVQDGAVGGYQQPFPMAPAIIPNNYPVQHPAHGHPPVQEQFQLQSQAPAPILPQPETPTPIPTEPGPSKRSKPSSSRKASAAKGKKSAAIQGPAQPPPARGPSKRTRRPTKLILDSNAMGDDDDDDDDEDEELQMQFRRESEYDRYQALTLPGSPALLGKRNRKNRMDLAQAMDSPEDDDDNYSS